MADRRCYRTCKATIPGRPTVVRCFLQFCRLLLPRLLLPFKSSDCLYGLVCSASVLQPLTFSLVCSEKLSSNRLHQESFVEFQSTRRLSCYSLCNLHDFVHETVFGKNLGDKSSALQFLCCHTIATENHCRRFLPSHYPHEGNAGAGLSTNAELDKRREEDGVRNRVDEIAQPHGTAAIADCRAIHCRNDNLFRLDEGLVHLAFCCVSAKIRSCERPIFQR